MQEKGRSHARPDRVAFRDIYEREVPPPRDRKLSSPAGDKADSGKAGAARAETPSEALDGAAAMEVDAK